MAMAENWLDEVFAAEDAKAAFANHPRTRKAFADAALAYKEAKDMHLRNPGICGGVPEQSARSAFIEALGLQIPYDICGVPG